MNARATVTDLSDELVIPRPPALPSTEGLESVAASVELEQSALQLGSAILLTAEVVFFGALTTLVLLVRRQHPEAFIHGAYYADTARTLFVTILLFTSGLTAALATRWSNRADGRSLAAMVATCVLGVAFVASQALGVYDDAQGGLLPGESFHPSQPVWQTTSFSSRHPAASDFAERLVRARRSTVAHDLESQVRPLRDAGVLGSKATYAELPSAPRAAHLFHGVLLSLMSVHALRVLAGVFGWLWLLLGTRRATSASRRTWVQILTQSWQFALVLWGLWVPLLT